MFKNNYLMFPSNPNDGDTHTHNQRTYTYHVPKNTWYSTGIGPDDVLTQAMAQELIDPNDTTRGDVVSYSADVINDELWLHARQRQIADLHTAEWYIQHCQNQIAENEAPAVPIADLETFIEDITWCFVGVDDPADVQFPKRPWD